MAGKRKPRLRAPDVNQNAFRIVREASVDDEGESPPEQRPEKNPAAVALGKLGGKKGGTARAASLTPEQRKEIARKAAAARWDKPRAAESD
jgi:hypothetical protein